MRESPATVLQSLEKAMKAVSASASRYAMIHQVLRDAIVNGTARHGLVLLEAPLAELFGTSRVPVRKALDLLHDEGLICRFNGRGYLINPEGLAMEPLRLPLSHAHLGLNGEDELVDTRPLGERIVEEIGAALSTCIAFGHYRLDEQAAADHYGVSRAVVREALMRLRDRGLVEKEPYSQWLAGPLTAREVTEDYELRACLEPEALRQSAPHLDRELLEAMLQRVLEAQDSPQCSLEAIEQIEEDLHQRCLAGLQNRKIAALIRQGQSPMIISRIFYRLLGIGADPQQTVENPADDHRALALADQGGDLAVLQAGQAALVQVLFNLLNGFQAALGAVLRFQHALQHRFKQLAVEVRGALAQGFRLQAGTQFVVFGDFPRRQRPRQPLGVGLLFDQATIAQAHQRFAHYRAADAVVVGSGLLVESVVAEGNAGGQRRADFLNDALAQRPRVHQLIFSVKPQMRMAQGQAQRLHGQAFGVDQVTPAVEAADQAFVMQQVQRLAHRYATGAEQFGQRRFQQHQAVTGGTVDDRVTQHLVNHRVTGGRGGHCFHRFL